MLVDTPLLYACKLGLTAAGLGLLQDEQSAEGTVMDLLEHVGFMIAHASMGTSRLSLGSSQDLAC